MPTPTAELVAVRPRVQVARRLPMDLHVPAKPCPLCAGFIRRPTPWATSRIRAASLRTCLRHWIDREALKQDRVRESYPGSAADRRLSGRRGGRCDAPIRLVKKRTDTAKDLTQDPEPEYSSRDQEGYPTSNLENVNGRIERVSVHSVISRQPWANKG